MIFNLMKIVFFGTPDYVLPILTTIHKKYVTGPGKSPIVAVVTQSPKPTGRKQILNYSPVDKWAHEHKIPIYYKSNDIIKENLDADLGVCASFGEIIPELVINYFKFGILNIHPSLLPKYRGVSPVPEALKNGDTKTGITIIKMDEKMDHGPIVVQSKEEVFPDDTGESLRTRLFQKSVDILIETIEPYLKGKIKLKEQNHNEAIFTKILTKQDGFLELTGCDPVSTERFIRAMQPWPGAWTLIDGKRLKILQAHLENEKLVLDEVQLEGKNPVTYQQFKEGYPSEATVVD